MKLEGQTKSIRDNLSQKQDMSYILHSVVGPLG